MDFVAKVIMDLPLEEGVSKAGNPWRKKSWVVETFGQYPKKVKMDAFGAAVDNVRLELMKVYNISVDLESREFNGRWYTDVRVFRAVETQDPSMMPQGGYQAPQPGVAPAAPVADPFSAQPAMPAADPFAAAPGAAGAAAFGDATDDLPF